MIQHKVIDGLLLRDMLVAGANLLEQNREAVDALNVFPVPDGDTGTNMSLTMQSAVREINAQEYLRADEAAAAISKGALKGARGNSGSPCWSRSGSARCQHHAVHQGIQ